MKVKVLAPFRLNGELYKAGSEIESDDPYLLVLIQDYRAKVIQEQEPEQKQDPVSIPVVPVKRTRRTKAEIEAAKEAAIEQSGE